MNNRLDILITILDVSLTVAKGVKKLITHCKKKTSRANH